MPPSKRRFRVGLSFPGERRAYVKLVAKSLAETLGEERVLYDEYLTAELARPDMDVHLTRLYKDCDLLVPFLCAEYGKKKWCKLEWRQMRDILLEIEGERLMLFRFDNAPIDGVLGIDGYVMIGHRTEAQVANLILNRLGQRVPQIPWYKRVRSMLAHPATLGAMGPVVMCVMGALLSPPASVGGWIGALGFHGVFIVLGARAGARIFRMSGLRILALAAGAATAATGIVMVGLVAWLN